MGQVNSTLYALNKDGSYQEWRVMVDENAGSVIVEYGKLGGKKMNKVTFCSPKNVGRSNETTANEQALLEAKSKWEKQIRLGYRESKESLQTEENFSPMLAHDAIKRSKDIEYPCYVQPKLDGVRCIVTFDVEGNPVFNSRGNKVYPVQGAIVQQIKELREHTGFDKFDGELYIHGLSLQKIVSLVKKWRSKEEIEQEINKEYLTEVKKWKKNPEAYQEPVRDELKYGGYSSDDLYFYIFDIPVNNESPWFYKEKTDCCRLADLVSVSDSLETELELPKISMVAGQFVDNEENVKKLIGVFMQKGFEGVIIRNSKGVYEYGQRSVDLQKWKLFQDGEAKVIDSVEDKNGEGVLLCEEKDGTRFSCKMKGTHAERSQEKMRLLIGSFINFTFQSRTDDGVPQFAIGQSVREVDSVTWEPLM